MHSEQGWHEHTVVIVDDEQSARNSIRRVLESADLSCKTFENAVQALEFLSENHSKVPVIISDYRMPGLNGLEFLARCRTSWPEIPRILLTAFIDQLSLRDVVNEARIFRFIEKPFNNEELIEVTKEAFSSYQRFLSPTEPVAEGSEDLRFMDKLIEAMSEQTSLSSGMLLSIKDLLGSSSRFDPVDWDFQREVAKTAVKIGTSILYKSENLPLLSASAVLYIHILKNPDTVEIPEKALELSLALCDSCTADFIRAEYSNISKIARHTSEHFDGSGSPDSLSGDRIPMASRIIATAHYYHTLINISPGKRFIVDFLKWNTGKIFDPSVVKKLIEVINSN